MNSGRPYHEKWQNGFERVTSISGKCQARCKTCGRIIANTSKARFQMHRNVCTFRGIEVANTATTSHTKLTVEVEKLQIHNFSRVNIGQMDQHCDKIAEQEKEFQYLKLSQFFFGCNIALSVVESAHFKDFCKSLRPAFRPPSRRILSSRLLDEAYEKFCKSLTFKEKSVLLIDGWKNESNNTKNVTAMLHASTGEAMFLETWDFSEKSETGDNLAAIVEECIQIAKTDHGSTIYAVVTDNASNMVKMGRQVNLWHTTCNSHIGNLLAHDIVSKEIVGKVQAVLKAFQGPDAEKKILKYQGSMIHLSCDTRWCSNRDSFKCFLKNLMPMRRILAENEVVLPQSKGHIVPTLLYNVAFIKAVEDSVLLLDPVCELINKCQSSKASIADAAHFWISLQLPDGYSESRIAGRVEVRRDLALTIYTKTAYFLHPGYKGEGLNAEQLIEVQTFLIDELDGDGLRSLQLFTDKEQVFGKLFQKNNLDALTFWNLAASTHKQLGNCAIKLLSIPASTAQLERIFSNWSYVHSQKRNKLVQDRSKKLVAVYYALKQLDTAVSDEY